MVMQVRRSNVEGTEASARQAFTELQNKVRDDIEATREKADKFERRAKQLRREADRDESSVGDWSEAKEQLDYTIERWKKAVQMMERWGYDKRSNEYIFALNDAELHEKSFKKLSLGWKVFWL